jgi:hypothetical protein
VIADVVRAPRDGLSAALVLRGEAGVGKTELLLDAIGCAADLRVLQISGVETEMELGYAGIHQLLRPELARLDGLPVRLRASLLQVFGHDDGDPPDRLLIGLAVLTLLADLAADDGLLCVVDDAQWLDQSSAEVLAFVARRLFADRVAMLFAVREPGPAVDLAGIPELRVEGLDATSAVALLTEAIGEPLDAVTASGVVTELHGNPLAITELGRELTAEQVQSRPVLAEPLPLGRRLEGRFLRQVRGLDPRTQDLLLTLAAEPTGDVELIWRSGVVLGFDDMAAGPAIAEGILDAGDGLRFRHPLMRSAVYHGAGGDERRRVHAALAEAIDDAGDADRRAWHRAAATLARDAAVADELVAAASRARARGGYPSAAAFLSRAAALTPDPGLRRDRSLEAAAMSLYAGAPARARHILSETTPGLDDRRRAHAQRLEGLVHLALRETRDTAGSLVRAAVALRPFDPSLARETLLDAVTAATYAGPLAVGADLADIAVAVREVPLPSGVASTSGDGLLDALAVLGTAGLVDGVAAVRQAAARVLHDDADPRDLLRWLGFACAAAGAIGDRDLRHTLAQRHEQLARSSGALGALSSALHFLGMSEVCSGAFNDADAHFDEESQIEDARGAGGLPGAAGSLLVLAWRGRETPAREIAARLADGVDEHGSGWIAMLADHGLAVLELGLGRYQEAAMHAGRAVATDHLLSTTALPDAIEAAVRVGDRTAALEWYEDLVDRATANGSPFQLGLLARAQALVADDDEVVQAAHHRAIELLQVSGAAGHAARAHLLHGQASAGRSHCAAGSARRLPIRWCGGVRRTGSDGAPRDRRDGSQANRRHPRRPHAAGGAGRSARRSGGHQPGDRCSDVPQRGNGGVPPPQGVPEARHPVAASIGGEWLRPVIGEILRQGLRWRARASAGPRPFSRSPRRGGRRCSRLRRHSPGGRRRRSCGPATSRRRPLRTQR